VDRAIADFDKVIGLKPDYATAYESRARALVSKGDYTRAVADVTKAGELTPKLAVRPKAVPSATRSAVAKPAAKPPKPVAKPVATAKASVPVKQPEPDWPDWAPKPK
jgi:hypothetical protein